MPTKSTRLFELGSDITFNGLDIPILPIAVHCNCSTLLTSTASSARSVDEYLRRVWQFKMYHLKENQSMDVKN
jgi:hypothetical protein